MAIYHLSVKTIGRSAGRTATAAAAYRAGAEITDERTGEVHDYRRKRDVESATLLVPEGAPEWATNRAALWNAAEQSETRKNSTVAREFEIALPSELSADERQAMAHAFAREIVARHGCAADVAIHAPGREGDHRNHHAHILCTTRRLTPDGFGKKCRELDDRKTKAVDGWRERFADLQNEHLERAGVADRVDHRSLKEQGIERAPTRHLGPAATGYERRTGEASRKRLDFEREAAERLVLARQAGELERQSQQAERSILDLSGDLQAAKAERDRQPTPDLLQVAAAGVADFRAKFEAMQQIEAGKQQAREAFERFKADQERQRQAEQARQQAVELAAVQALAQRQAEQKAVQQEKKQSQEREQAREREQKRERDGPGWSR